MSKLVTKGGVEVQLLNKVSTKATLYSAHKTLDDKGNKVNKPLGDDHVRAVFPDGSVQVVNLRNLREVK